MVQTLSNNYSNFNNTLLSNVSNFKNIIPNGSYYYTSESIQPLIKNLPANNYIKCFCPIHGDQPDNFKHKCSVSDNGIDCISSLRYNCAHCSNENGRSLSHIAFQKHLHKFHSNSLENMKIRDNLNNKENIYTSYVTSIISKQKNSDSFIGKKKEYNGIVSNTPLKKKDLNSSKKRKKILYRKININTLSIEKTKNISISPNSINSNSNYSFICLQLICACELLLEKTLEEIFHESYLSYDIPTKLMVLKYAITDKKIPCDDTVKIKLTNCIEALENYFNSNIKIDSIELEKDLKLFLQFLLNY
ncbi:hypothetical protein BCR36DRAFT_343353, partial [Piromyces finnis]